MLSERYFKDQVHIFTHHLKISFYIALIIVVLFMAWLICWLIQRGKKQAEKQFVRGARMASARIVSKMIKKQGASDVMIESVPMVKNF